MTAFFTADSSVVFVGSNYHTYGTAPARQSFEAFEEGKTYPANVTLAFRRNFWRVFSRVAAYDPPASRLTWLGRGWSLQSLWLAEGTGREFFTTFNDQGNVLLGFVLKPDAPLDKPVSHLVFDHGLNEQSAIAALIDACGPPDRTAFLRSFRHAGNLNALFVWDTGDQPGPISDVVALFFFYSFARLTIWRIAREQDDIAEALEEDDFRERMRGLLRLRAHIIGIEQCLMTPNISNHPVLGHIASAMKAKYGLRTRLEDLLPLNEAIQSYFETVSRLRDDVRSAMMNVILGVLALVGLPLSFMSMLLALHPDAPIVAAAVPLLARLPV